MRYPLEDIYKNDINSCTHIIVTQSVKYYQATNYLLKISITWCLLVLAWFNYQARTMTAVIQTMKGPRRARSVCLQLIRSLPTKPPWPSVSAYNLWPQALDLANIWLEAPLHHCCLCGERVDKDQLWSWHFKELVVFVYGGCGLVWGQSEMITSMFWL